jgi:hypothetical protein
MFKITRNLAEHELGESDGEFILVIWLEVVFSFNATRLDVVSFLNL